MKTDTEKLLARHLGSKLKINTKKIEQLVMDILGLLYPHFSEEVHKESASIEKLSQQIRQELNLLFKNFALKEETKIDSFMASLAMIADTLDKDAEAILSGDPAATTIDEVILCYPGFFAIATYRLAHSLYLLNVPIIPRLMTEFAHSKTGIDIHPGASIAESFFIDHGTGIVIGETTIIGKNVKIYQGVTLGALSVKKSFQHKKRHPTIEDDVVIYANATILGGETIIGHHSIIGGSTWITKSTPPHTQILKGS